MSSSSAAADDRGENESTRSVFEPTADGQPPLLSLITLHGAGAAGKSSFLEAVSSFIPPASSPLAAVRHTVFLETGAGIARATAELYPKQSRLSRLLHPVITLRAGGASAKHWIVRVTLQLALLAVVWRQFSFLPVVLLLLCLCGSFSFPPLVRLFHGLTVSAVWNFERLQHKRVQRLASLREADDGSSSSSRVVEWLWLDRCTVDAYSLCVLMGDVKVGADFWPILQQQTQQVGCGIWMDTSVDLICQHHRARAKQASSRLLKLLCLLLANVPRIWLPTVRAVQSVEDWYAQHDIPFIKLSEWRAARSLDLRGLDDVGGEMVWNSHNLHLLLCDVQQRIARTSPVGRSIQPTPWLRRTLGWDD
jgi:hypothetical protein